MVFVMPLIELTCAITLLAYVSIIKAITRTMNLKSSYGMSLLLLISFKIQIIVSQITLQKVLMILF